MGTRTVANLTAVISANNTKFKKGIKGAKTSLGGFQKTIGKLGSMIAGAFAIGAIKNFAKASMEAYDTQLKSEAALLTALDGRIIAQQKLIRQSQALQRITLFGDEETIAAQAMIAAFVDQEEQIMKLIPLIQDFATAKQMGLVQAADLVTKTFASSTNALSRYGIEVNGAALSTARLDDIVNALTSSFAGQAEAAAMVDKVFTQLKNTYGDFQESLAGFVSQKGRFGIFNVIQEDLENISAWLNSNTDEIFKKAAKSVEEFMESLSGKDKQQQLAEIQKRIEGVTERLKFERTEYKRLGELAEDSGRRQANVHERAQDATEDRVKTLFLMIEILGQEADAMARVADETENAAIATSDLDQELRDLIPDVYTATKAINALAEEWRDLFKARQESQAEMDLALFDDEEAQIEERALDSLLAKFNTTQNAAVQLSDTLAVAFSNIGSAFAESLGQIAAGTKTFEEALKDIGAMILQSLGDILILIGLSTSPIGVPLVLAGLALKGFGSFVNASGGEATPGVQSAFLRQQEGIASRIYGNDIMTANNYAVETYNRVG